MQIKHINNALGVHAPSRCLRSILGLYEITYSIFYPTRTKRVWATKSDSGLSNRYYNLDFPRTILALQIFFPLSHHISQFEVHKIQLLWLHFCDLSFPGLPSCTQNKSYKHKKVFLWLMPTHNVGNSNRNCHMCSQAKWTIGIAS